MSLCSHIRTLGQALTDFVYPPHCILCQSAIAAAGDLLCVPCWNQLGPLEAERCRRCGCPLEDVSDCRPRGPSASDRGVCADSPYPPCANCRSWDPALERVLVMAAFEGAMQEAVHALKFGRQQKLGRELGRRFGRSRPFDAHLTSVDLLVPVPLHPARHRERGYNQAECISAGLSGVIQKPMATSLLRRRRATRQQAKLDAVERARNLEGAFELVGRPPEGVRIGLVDDVVTTASTLSSCARVLDEGGAASVWALALASPYPLSAAAKGPLS